MCALQVAELIEAVALTEVTTSNQTFVMHCHIEREEEGIPHCHIEREEEGIPHCHIEREEEGIPPHNCHCHVPHLTSRHEREVTAFGMMTKLVRREMTCGLAFGDGDQWQNRDDGDVDDGDDDYIQAGDDDSMMK